MAEPLDILWIVVASALVFVMQAGFAMVESGLTRSKNSINVAIKNLTDLGVSLLSFWIIGFGLMFGASLGGLLGGGHFFFEPVTTWGAVFFLFHAMFCSTSATIVSGAVAERMRYSSYILSTVFLSLLLYPVFGHWVWGGGLDGGVPGWLGAMGFIDFAGSTVVHSLGGWVALAILLIIGPRKGRFNQDGSPNPINGSNIPMVVLGVIILWFGWFGFNGGSTLAMSADVPAILLKTSLSAAAAMMGSLALGWPMRKKPDVTLVMNGALAGLVAITAPVHAVTAAQSVLIGLIGGAVMLASEELLIKLRIDDAVGAIPVHLAAGAWGTLAVGLMGDLEILGTGLSRIDQIGVQAMGILACGVWAFTLTFLVLKLINRFIPLRVTLEEEKAGLNMAEHGVTTEILDLYVTMDNQRQTGDLSLRAPVEPFTEAGQIAGMYNQVLDNLEANTVEKSAYLDILQNVNDGIFLLYPDKTIGPYYSAAMESIFHKDNLAGQSLDALMGRYLKDKDQKNMAEFLDICFNGTIPWRQADKLNPLKEAELFMEESGSRSETKFLSFHFKRIGEKRSVRQLLVMVRDITKQKELSLEVEKTRQESRSEMELLYKILHVEPEIMMEFLTSLEGELQEINRGFQESSTGTYRERLEATFLHTHTIKGEAELLQVDFIAERAEDLEKNIQEILARKAISPSDFLPLTLVFSELQKTAAKVRQLLTKWLNVETPGERGPLPAPEVPYSRQLAQMVTRLGEEYQKEVTLQIPENLLERIHQDKQKIVKNILVQLLRNAVYHGIEAPSVRQARGKESQGRIQVDFKEGEAHYLLQVRDDGNGINRNKLIAKGIDQGLIQGEDQEITQAQLLQLLFASGVSTADKPDRIAGKGVGMGLVRSLVKDLKGSLKIQSKPGIYTDFSIQIPKESLN